MQSKILNRKRISLFLTLLVFITFLAALKNEYVQAGTEGHVIYDESAETLNTQVELTQVELTDDISSIKSYNDSTKNVVIKDVECSGGSPSESVPVKSSDVSKGTNMEWMFDEGRLSKVIEVQNWSDIEYTAYFEKNLLKEDLIVPEKKYEKVITESNGQAEEPEEVITEPEYQVTDLNEQVQSEVSPSNPSVNISNDEITSTNADSDSNGVNKVVKVCAESAVTGAVLGTIGVVGAKAAVAVKAATAAKAAATAKAVGATKIAANSVSQPVLQSSNNSSIQANNNKLDNSDKEETTKDNSEKNKVFKYDYSIIYSCCDEVLEQVEGSSEFDEMVKISYKEFEGYELNSDSIMLKVVEKNNVIGIEAYIDYVNS